jgi:type II secretory pathway pseudopilin PulG
MGRTRVHHDERGITFVEMVVAMAIAAVVGSLLIAALSMVTRVDKFTREDSQALGELRTATERFQKEMRQARKVYDVLNVPASTASIVHFWVDYNRDNQQTANERIIWRFETSSAGIRLVRTSDEKEAAAQSPFVEAVGLVSGSAFTYSPSPPETTVVTMTLRADIGSGSNPSPRTIQTRVRLRNATA